MYVCVCVRGQGAVDLMASFTITAAQPDVGADVSIVVRVDNACGLLQSFLLAACAARRAAGSRPRMLSSCRPALLSKLFLLAFS